MSKIVKYRKDNTVTDIKFYDVPATPPCVVLNLNDIDSGIDEYTVVMLQFDKSATKDECGNSWSATGSPSLSTNAKFGGNAISVDNDNYIQLENFYIGGKDFTIDYWACVTGIATLFSMKNGDSLFQYYYDDFESWFKNNISSENYKSNITFSTNTWHHIAVVYQYSAETVKTFVDGSLAATFTGKTIPYGDYSPVCIGKNIRIGGTAALIDELRITDSSHG